MHYKDFGEEIIDDATIAESSLYAFFKQAWPNIENDVELVDGWHIEAICDHLEACYHRHIRNLLINIPPRTGKTNLISVAFPAWCWLKRPSEKFLCASTTNSLSLEIAGKSRRLIESYWFQQNWGDRVKLLRDQNAKSYYENDKGGYRISTSVGSSIVGKGGSIKICDDPNDPGDFSKLKRESVKNWFMQKWPSRNADLKNVVEIVVQQRCHNQDVCGLIIDSDTTNKEWTKLILPMEFESQRRSQTYINNTLIWQDPRQKDGDLLTPKLMDKEFVCKVKRTLGSYGYAAQYQQRPSPEGGGIIKKNWFKWWKNSKLPKLEHVIQSWDTAISDNPTAAYSACTTWGVFYSSNDLGNVILLSSWRGRVGYPELRQRAVRLQRDYNDIGTTKPLVSNAHNVDVVLIENKATGDPLIRDLRQAGILATPYNPTRQGDKEGRVQKISHYIEGGLVWLPAQQPAYERLVPFADDFVEAVANFPSDDSRDLVDTLSQVLSYLRDHNFLNHPRDERKIETRTRPPILY